MSQNAIGGGGRYDGLFEALSDRGTKKSPVPEERCESRTPAVGWAMGLDRLALLMAENTEKGPDLCVLTPDRMGF